MTTLPVTVQCGCQIIALDNAVPWLRPCSLHGAAEYLLDAAKHAHGEIAKLRENDRTREILVALHVAIILADPSLTVGASPKGRSDR